MISFDRIKEAVTTREAAEFYGVSVNRYGFALCPFHQEKTPSMKVDKRFHCFGCGEDGDVIDFTAKLFDLDLKTAAQKLAFDFGLDANSLAVSAPAVTAKKSSQKVLEEDFSKCWNLYCDYLHLLRHWEKTLCPQSMDDDYDERFVEALHNIHRVEYYLDELMDADWETRKTIMKDLQEDMKRIAKKPEFSRLSGRDELSL